MTTPAGYAVGALKQDPTTHAVAMRTSLPTVDDTLSWIVSTHNYGAHYAKWTEVAGWRDIPGTPVS